MTRTQTLTLPDQKMDASSWVEVDLSRLDANVAAIRSILERRKLDAEPPLLCAAIKADAYGMGILPIASRLQRQVDLLAVYSQTEASQLITAGIVTPIFVLGPIREIDRTSPLYRTAITGRLHLSLHDFEQIDSLNESGRRLGSRLRTHLYVDTGMCRSGIGHEDLPRVLQAIHGARHLELVGIYTHIATADTDQSRMDEQVQLFDAALEQAADLIPPDTLVHLANTFATYRAARYHRDMVRVGLGLYGYGPDLLEAGDVISDCETPRPIVRWCSRVNHMRQVKSGESVGYGGTQRLWSDSLVGIIPVGYGDGYPLALSGKGMVSIPSVIEGEPPRCAPVLGRVNMDQIIVDLTQIEGARVGMQVDVYSDEPASPCALPALAKAAGSHCYEMLTRISPRVPRVYL